MKLLAYPMLFIASHALAQGMVSTPSGQPPAVSVPLDPPPPTVINAITGRLEPPHIIAVSPNPPPPTMAYPPVAFPKGPPPVPAARLVRGPQPRLPAQDLVTPQDYPASALAMRAEGRVSFVLTVGASGRVLDCLITRSDGISALDSTTCRIMRSRARFTPAMDSSGNAVPATIEQQVEWKLPD